MVYVGNYNSKCLLGRCGEIKMNKKEWKEGMNRIINNLETAKANLKIAENNVIIVEGQVEESEFILEAYEEKIKTFK